MPPTYVHPVHLYTPICSYTPPYVCTPPRGVHNPQGPPCSLCSCMVLEHCMLWGVFFCLMCIGTHHPYVGGASPFITPPHTPLLVLCAFLFSGISVLMWAFPLLWKGLGCSPFTGEVGGTSALQLFTCSFLYIFL